MFLDKIIILSLLACVTSPLKILGLFPYSGKSHFVSYEPLLKELAVRGHHVHVLSEFPQKQPLSGYKDLTLQKTVSTEVLDFTSLPPKWLMRYATVFILSKFARDTCDKLDQEVVKDLLNTKEKFDLILIEYFNTDCYLGFAHKFDVPIVGLSSCYPMPWHAERTGTVDNPSYVPNHFGWSSSRMGFFERLENSFFYVYTKVFYKLLMDVPNNRKAKEVFGDDLPELEKLAEKTSLILVNNHVTLNGAFPKVPGMIDVGGMFLGEPKQVPKNMEKWINESKDGVIYFSMGSMLIGSSFPEDKRVAFQRAFSKLKQRVLWKWEDETMPGKPDNVMIQKWMPQFDILCHPNVKAFISHGGLLGTTEAVHCGVPAVVMPQYGDQFTNAKALEAAGGGVILDFASITEETITEALNTILKPSFKKQAEELSARFKDRPMSAMDTAIYWIEYVARHKGAPHLRTAAVGMPLYQYLLLDVIGFFIAIFAVIYYATKCTIKFIFNKLFGKKTKKQKTN